jgi:hypothetical protein
MENIIPVISIIRNFLSLNGLDAAFSKSATKHIITFMLAMVLKGYSGKVNDVAEISVNHRTTVSRFLREGKWDEEYLKNFIRTKTFQHIQTFSEKENKPFFVSIDDTVNCKTKPSSKAKNPIQGAEYHHSHLKGKQVWGHQVVAVMLSSGREVQNYDIHRYDKKTESKIAYVVKLAKSLPKPQTHAYALGDSWYTNSKIIDAFAERGYYYIGAIKTNRIIYPKNERISIVDYAAQVLQKADFNLVTVNKAKYNAYRYKGKLNGIDEAVVIITVPEGGFDSLGNISNLKSVKAFISTDTTLDTQRILEYYTQRWCIETFFRQEKCALGFDKYQLRSIKGIERQWTLTSLCYLMCTTGLGRTMPFGEGLRSLRPTINKKQIATIYQFAQNNTRNGRVSSTVA